MCIVISGEILVIICLILFMHHVLKTFISSDCLRFDYFKKIRKFLKYTRWV